MIASISKTNEILNKYNLRAKKGFGQNFIIESGVVAKIASSSFSDDAVIEIGPGIGALTEQLALISKKVISFEIDENLIPVLDEVLKEYKNVEIVNKDFLEINLKEVVDRLLLEYKKVSICANLPYYITTPILFKIFESNASVDYITVMVQKEVADRFKAKCNSSDYNALSVITQYLYDVSLVMVVSASVFNPKPNVDSAVIQFRRKNVDENFDREKFFKFVKMCFKQRRKTLYNNLKDSISKEIINKVLLENGLKESVRAQEISLNTFIKLFENFKEYEVF